MLRSRGSGGKGSIPPLKNHKNIGFLSNTSPDPLKNNKATKLAFNVEPSSARQWNAIKWCFAGGRWWPAFRAILILFSLIQKLSELDPLWQNILDPRMRVLVISPVNRTIRLYTCNIKLNMIGSISFSLRAPKSIYGTARDVVLIAHASTKCSGLPSLVVRRICRHIDQLWAFQENKTDDCHDWPQYLIHCKIWWDSHDNFTIIITIPIARESC